MSRTLIPGTVDRHGVARPLPHCTGSCHGARRPCDCPTGQTELANTHAHLHLVRSVASRPPIQMTAHPTPLHRRVGRFLADLWAHLTSECWS